MTAPDQNILRKVYNTRLTGRLNRLQEQWQRREPAELEKLLELRAVIRLAQSVAEGIEFAGAKNPEGDIRAFLDGSEPSVIVRHAPQPLLNEISRLEKLATPQGGGEPIIIPVPPSPFPMAWLWGIPAALVLILALLVVSLLQGQPTQSTADMQVLQEENASLKTQTAGQAVTIVAFQNALNTTPAIGVEQPTQVPNPPVATATTAPDATATTEPPTATPTSSNSQIVMGNYTFPMPVVKCSAHPTDATLRDCLVDTNFPFAGRLAISITSCEFNADSGVMENYINPNGNLKSTCAGSEPQADFDWRSAVQFGTGPQTGLAFTLRTEQQWDTEQLNLALVFPPQTPNAITSPYLANTNVSFGPYPLADPARATTPMPSVAAIPFEMSCQKDPSVASQIACTGVVDVKTYPTTKLSASLSGCTEGGTYQWLVDAADDKNPTVACQDGTITFRATSDAMVKIDAETGAFYFAIGMCETCSLNDIKIFYEVNPNPLNMAGPVIAGDWYIYGPFAIP